MKKAQFTFVGVIVVFVTLIIFMVMYPILNEFITTYSANMDATTATLLKMTPFFMVVSIILSMLFYITPQQQDQRFQ